MEVTGGRVSDTEERRRATAAKIVIGREEIDKFGDANVGEVRTALAGAAAELLDLRSIPEERRGDSFAGDVRQVVDYINDLDVVERAERRIHLGVRIVTLDRVLGERDAGPQDDERHRLLALQLVGHRHHAGLHDPGVALQHLLHGVAPEQVVASSIRTRLEYRDGKPVLIRLPEVDFIDDKSGKPVGISRFIGRRPIAAFGNSDGDFEMLEWTTTAPGRRLGLLDLTRAVTGEELTPKYLLRYLTERYAGLYGVV